MENGIVRKIDELGRITIPIEIRRTADVMNREKLNLSIINGVMRFSKANGEVAHSRGLDDLGRYTIPKELRKSHKWNIGQEMEIYVDDSEICIRKNGCEWCDNTEDLIEVKGHRICTSCGEAVKTALSL
jgi:transcriptional pleiotropic regulator of transition state genes